MGEMSQHEEGQKALQSSEPAASRTLELSVVIPVFDEQDSIQAFIPKLIEFLAARGPDFEIIAVDDGSRDETLKVLKQLSMRYPDRLRVAHHLINRGNGASLRTGLRLARGDIAVTMDADGQHAPEDIPRLLELIPPYDLVVASRTEAYPGIWYRNLANGFYNRFASWLTRAEIKDLTSGFRAMRRSVVSHFLPLFPNGFSAPTTTTMAFLKAGYNVAFVPVHVGQRTHGQSKIRPWEDGARFLMVILRMIMLYDPLRIFLPLGLALFGLGLLSWAAGVLVAGRLVIPNSAILALSSSLMIWLLGLISDQIANSRVQYHGDESIVVFGPDGEEIPDLHDNLE